MERDPSQTLYTVTLTGVKDKNSQLKLAHTLSSVSGRLPMEAVVQRLNALPWTLTRKASYKRAYRLIKLLESLGGQVRCTPPLQQPVKPLMDETQILAGGGLLSQTQIMSDTQFIATPDEQPPAPAPDIRPTRLAAKKPEIPPTPEPVEMDAQPDQPASEETAAPVEVGFFRKHLWTILAGILGTVATAGGLVLAYYILAKFRG